MDETKYKGVVFHRAVIWLSKINFRVHRITSMLLDHIIMTFAIVPPLIILIIIGESGFLKMENVPFSMAFSAMMFIYINKDFIKAKSLAKRILGYQVINLKNGKPATELQCFLRNLTIFVGWPLEVIIGYINPERRIGDFIANTKVVKAEKEKLKSIFTDLKHKQFKISFLIIVLLGVIYSYGIYLILPSTN